MREGKADLHRIISSDSFELLRYVCNNSKKTSYVEMDNYMAFLQTSFAEEGLLKPAKVYALSTNPP